MTASSSRPEPSTSSRAVAPAFTLAPPGPSPWGRASAFLEGFAPAGYDATGAPGLDLAFPVEGSWAPVGARVGQASDGTVHGQVFTARPSHAEAAVDVDAVRAQVERILSLDDGDAFAGVGDRDPVVHDDSRATPGCARSPSGPPTRPPAGP